MSTIPDPTETDQPPSDDSLGSVESLDRAEGDGGVATNSARPNLRDDVEGGHDRAGSGGASGDSPGMPGGTMGTDGASEQDL